MDILETFREAAAGDCVVFIGSVKREGNRWRVGP